MIDTPMIDTPVIDAADAAPRHANPLACDLSAVVTADKEVVSCELGGGAALLDMRSGTYFGLNKVAARIWASLSEPATLSALLEDILKTYDVDRERAEADLRRTLAMLRDAGLIHVEARAAG